MVFVEVTAHFVCGRMLKNPVFNKFLVCLHGQYNILDLFSFVETPRKFTIAELSIRKLGSSSVLVIPLIIPLVLLALMKIRAYGSKALQ